VPARPCGATARPATGDDLDRRVADAIEVIEILRQHLGIDRRGGPPARHVRIGQSTIEEAER
jgi:hypothetical protein